MPRFLAELDARLKDDDSIWILNAPLVFESDFLGKIEVPAGFETDFASVPRVPIAFMLFGDRAHRESVLHDYLYRIDSVPQASFDEANDIFLEAMKCRGKGAFVRYTMYWGVCFGGRGCYHKRYARDKL